MTRLDDYRKVGGTYRVPSTSRAWNLYGAGLENLRLEAMPMPKPAADQLLVRVDAVGVCASDWKMISQGSSHARMKGRDLAAEPTVPGHEVSMTVVGLGKALVFGWAVVFAAGYKGFFIERGAEGVGQATTESVVLSIALIIALDCVFAFLLY